MALDEAIKQGDMVDTAQCPIMQSFQQQQKTTAQTRIAAADHMLLFPQNITAGIILYSATSESYGDSTRC